MLAGGRKVEQHDADAERLVGRHPPPELIKAGEQKAGIARLKEGAAAKIGNPPCVSVSTIIFLARAFRSSNGQTSFRN